MYAMADFSSEQKSLHASLLNDSVNNDKHMHNEDGPVPMTPRGAEPTLGLLAFSSIMFFAVSGGPFGIEVAMSAAPPFICLLAFTIVPILWGMPQGLVSAELASAMPQDGGCVIWVDRAFGKYWSFQVGWWNIASSFFDNAIYPTLFIQYLQQLSTAAALNDFTNEFLIGCAVTGFIAGLNISGVELVGNASTVFTIVCLTPFFLLMGYGLPKVKAHVIFSTVGVPIQWSLLLSTIIWSSSGFDSVGQLAGELKNPKRNYPLALLITLAACFVIYVLPLAAGTAADTDFADWDAGQFSSIAATLAGSWLSNFIAAAGCLSALGLFNVLLCCSTRCLWALADEGHLPQVLTKLNGRGEPWVATLVNSCIVLVMLLLPLSSLLEVDAILISVTTITEYLAFFWLRYKEPQMTRPFVIPGGWPAAVLIVLIPGFLAVFNIVTCKWRTLMFAVGLVTVGLFWPQFNAWWTKRKAAKKADN